MQTERFKRLRKKELSIIFEKQEIINVWRKIVKNQLRNTDLKDLYDNYDFNYNIEERAGVVRGEILNGTYKASQPLIYRIEKKFGICRHLVIPQPLDALVLQVLIENISDAIIEGQPSKNAFYSRDKHNVSFPHDFDDYGLAWRQQWKMMQKKIYNFNTEKHLMIVTDISNYYDSIDMNELRKVFTTFAKIPEVLVDLLFRIIEEISWTPDYLPYSRRGLPTTNIEGVRLLAHSFLYEIDNVIKEETNDNFTRWMDDIVIGIDSSKEAKEVISSVSDMLKSRGLALNLSKTDIYTADEGYFHFQIESNRYIDSIENTKKTDLNYSAVCIDMHKRFKKHLKDGRAKYWDKVAKRFITTYGKLESKSLLPLLPQLYIDYPALRINLLIYLTHLGYSKKTSDAVLKILNTIDLFDDLSLYQLCELITIWEIPIIKNACYFLAQFKKSIISFSFKRRVPSDFYCLLWFHIKYSDPQELLQFVNKYQNIWQKDSFLRRQVTASLSRLLITNDKQVRQILYNQISSGVASTVTIANQIAQFSEIEKVNFSLNAYLFPQKIQKIYPLPKFIVLCSVLNSPKVRSNKLVIAKIKYYIKDPFYLKWLKLQYNIS